MLFVFCNKIKLHRSTFVGYFQRHLIKWPNFLIILLLAVIRKQKEMLKDLKCDNEVLRSVTDTYCDHIKMVTKLLLKTATYWQSVIRY